MDQLIAHAAAWWTELSPWLASALRLALFVAAALLVHLVVANLLRAVARRSDLASDERVLARLRQPTRWAFAAIGVSIWRRGLSLSPDSVVQWQIGEGMAMALILGWIGIAMLLAMRDVVEIRSDISAANNLEARRRRTRASILTRIGIFMVAFVAIAAMLLAIPSVRNVGVTLMASAGLAGLAVGAAAQPALKNIIAGVQMAFTEPIRIDDVVVIEGEWGRIEEIRLTYVIVHIWDDRRLIVPVSRFLEAAFENWTRKEAGLLGSVHLMLDPRADIDRLRVRFEELVAAEPLFDGRAQVLQVTDSKADAIEVRMLMTASDSARAFDLRCAIREKMLAFVRNDMPEALPQTRLAVTPPG